MSFANFKPGWVPHDERTAEGKKAHEDALSKMPTFRIIGAQPDKPRKVMLSDFWKHPQVVGALGFEYPGVHQLSGSCVGAAGGNVLMTLSAIEVVQLGDRERIVVPFWLLPYGKSRQRAGFRGRGEGSYGSTFAEACREDGDLPADYEGLPKFRNGDGLEWGESVEYQWSDGAAIPSKYLTESRKFTVKTVAQANRATDIRDGIQNGYPATIAYGGYVGRGRVRGSGENAALVGEIDSRGGHQTSILAYWDNPELGPLYLYVNQWPASVYPKDPGGGPRCSVWITERTLDEICSERDSFVFSNKNGFPAQEIEKDLFRIIGA